MRIILIGICLFGIILVQAEPADPKQLFDEANAAFQQDNHSLAIQKYQQLVETGITNSEIYYNLGNCYFREQQIGKAILHYERAKVLAPRDKDILHNLEVAKSHLKDELEVLPAFFLNRWWKSLRTIFSVTVWSVLGIIMLWLAIAGLALWLVGASRSHRKWGFSAGWLFLFISILPFALAFSKSAFQKDSGTAIIMQEEIPLRSAPDEESAEIILLHEGTKVVFLDAIGAWHKISLSDGEVGWLPDSALEEI